MYLHPVGSNATGDVLALPGHFAGEPDISLILLPGHSVEPNLTTYAATEIDLSVLLTYPAAALAATARICHGTAVPSVVAVIITSAGRGTDDVRIHRELIGLVSAHLAEHMIGIQSAWVTGDITTEAAWQPLTTVTPDHVGSHPSTPTEIIRALAAGSIYSPRAAAHELMSPDLPLAREVAAHLTHRETTHDDSDIAPAPHNLAAELRQLLAIIEGAASGQTLAAGDLAAAARALRPVDIAECAAGLVHTSLDGPAHALWTALTQTAPNQYRGAPAVLLAYWACAHQDYTTASVALDIALEAQPGNKFAQWIAVFLDIGMPHAQYAKFAEFGRQNAARIGTELPS
ncbi:MULTISPECIES: DUF4192 family protein [Nocardia]|uniref:DUF4192 domain-containing protein n=1 Tax=Nocardia africana TaxID=134964 RepID=A0A378X816_9NOCA|nr:DUF4192 family protein [Nocardia africana]MCC3317928.1 DUF4192 domain-containing protein [Nocardia africana]SUA48703.1 Uncharacterised protein [Nocardia africana]